MPSNSIALQPNSNDWMVDLLASVIAPMLPVRLPEPVIRAAIRGIIAGASRIDRQDVAAVLGKLGAPPELVPAVWSTVNEQVEETCEVECPESGNTVRLTEGDGFYTCPDCRQEIEVDNGTGYHPYLEECSVTGEAYWIPAEEGSYSCPECATTVRVRGSTVTHGSPARRQSAAPRRGLSPARRVMKK